MLFIRHSSSVIHAVVPALIYLSGYELDIRARTHLHRYGWDYNHGTGHGISYFLTVSEGLLLFFLNNAGLSLDVLYCDFFQKLANNNKASGVLQDNLWTEFFTDCA
jgi:hypothetical protein